jgi:queuine/archaeosine tRNA-ribosyltransferase
VPWTLERYAEVVRRRYPFDIVLGFDDPLQEGEPNDAVERTIDLFRSGPRGGGSRVLVPVAHLPADREGRRDPETAEVVIRGVVDALDPAIVAIPERELGDGILARVRTVSAIRRSLSETGRYPLLHLLGTGNPLSILLLAAAGADLFDGLEWCRVAADRDTGRLYHAQHFDFFAAGMKFSEFEDVRKMEDDDEYPFFIKLLVHNIDFFHTWMEEVRDRISRGDAAGMVADYLGEPQAEMIDAACPGLFRS